MKLLRLATCFVVAMPHPQQAAMMSQLPSNRQTVVPPTQQVYFIPQQMTPQAPAVAGTFQPTQYGIYHVIGKPFLMENFEASTYVLTKFSPK